MAITKFVSGKWYKWVGKREYLGAPEPEKMCDGKPRKCTKVHERKITFKGIAGSWMYWGFEECFDLCPAPKAKKGKKS